MSRRALTTLLLFLPGFLVSGDQNMSHVCAIEGRYIALSHSFTAPGHKQNFFWFNSNQTWKWANEVMPEDLEENPDYEGRVMVTKVRHTNQRSFSFISIDDTKKSDAGYYCIYSYERKRRDQGVHICGVKLSVTDIQVLVSPPVVTLGQNVTLTCKTTCDTGHSYEWFKGRDVIQEGRSNTVEVTLNHTARYSCAIRGHRSPEVCLPGRCTGTSYYVRPVCGLLRASVDLPCTYIAIKGRNIKQKFWVRMDKNKTTDLANYQAFAGRVKYLFNETHCTMRLTKLSRGDSGTYKFRFIADDKYFTSLTSPISLQVMEMHMHIQDAFPHQGDRVWISCHTDCAHATLGNKSLVWYKDGQRLISPDTRDDYLLLKSVTKEHDGRYSCALVGFEGFPSKPVTLSVQEYGPELQTILTFALLALTLLAVTAFLILLYCALRCKNSGKTETVVQTVSAEPYVRYIAKVESVGRKDGGWEERASAKKKKKSVCDDPIYEDPDEFEDTYITVYPSMERTSVYENLRRDQY